MFDLEKAIASWRRQMIASGIKGPEVLDELESHLRDEVEAQVRSGLEPRNAFVAAIQKIGRLDELRAEFAKTNRFAPRLRKNFPFILCFGSAVFLLLVNGWTLLRYESSPAERIAGMAIVLVTAFYLIALPYFSPRLLPGTRKFVIVGAYAVMGICLSTVFFSVPLPGIISNLALWLLSAASAETIVVLCFRTGDSGPDLFDLTLLTPAAQQSLEFARDEATAFHHNFIGTEHVLLGLLNDEAGAVPRILKKRNLSRELIRVEIEKFVGAGFDCLATRTQPYTPRAKRAFELAAGEAAALDRLHVSNEDIFLGLLREGSGVAALVLKKLGVDLAVARREILEESSGENTN